MADEANNPDVAILARELDAALVNLDAALGQAGRSVSVIRANISQIATVAEAVRDMEAAITLARQNLSLPLAATRQPADAPPLRAVPAPAEPEPTAETAEPEPAAETAEPQPALAQTLQRLAAARRPAGPTAETAEPEPVAETAGPEPVAETAEPEPVAETAESEPVAETTESEPVAETAAPEPAAEIAEPEPAQAVSHCLRLTVKSNSGSLDLKAVDGSVNENPAVVDVALLDYDGRKATLKLWVNESADPIGVRDALLGSLRRRLGDEQAAEVHIDFEESAAA